MTKLTETQTIILSAGAQRPENIALPLPKGLAGAAAAGDAPKSDAKVDDADVIALRIRAFNPAPGAVSKLRGESVKDRKSVV